MSESLAGKCLLASPFMDDSNFFRSVVLLLQHSEEETFGLILNRPTDFRLDKVVTMVCECDCVHNAPLYCGGPVDGPLFAIHDSDNFGGHRFNDELFVTSDQEELKKLFSEPNVKFKLFDGFAGWGPGQLESELEAGGWLVSEISSSEILADEDCWESMVKRIGNAIVESSTDTCPVDPSWN